MDKRQIPAIRILIADDHHLARLGLRSMLQLSNLPIAFLLDEAETAEQAVLMAAKDPYEIVIMDYRIGTIGAETATRQILKSNPRIKVIGISSFNETACVHRMLRAGARGFLIKTVEPDTLVSAIKSVLNDKPYFSNEITQKIMADHFQDAPPTLVDQLTPREKEILKLILEGKTSKHISCLLFVSKRTIDKHRQNIMNKLQVKNSVELAGRAAAFGLL